MQSACAGSLKDEIAAIYNDSLARERAASIVIHRVVQLESGPVDRMVLPVFSQDGRLLLYARRPATPEASVALYEGPIDLVLRDLTSGEVRLTRSTLGPVRNMCLSKDATKVAYIDRNYSLAILDLTTGKDVSLPVRPSREAGTMYWLEDEIVEFVGGGSGGLGTTSVNLATLKEANKPYTTHEQMAAEEHAKAKTSYDHQHCVIVARRIREIDKTFLFVENKDDLFAKMLLEHGGTSGDFFAVSRNLRYVALGDYRGLSVAYLTTGQPVITEYVMEHSGTLKITSATDREVVRARQAGEPLMGAVYAPLLNPLNNRSIGADRKQYKGVVRITGWGTGYASVKAARVVQPFQDGDVVTDIGIYSRDAERRFSYDETDGILRPAASRPAITVSATPVDSSTSSVHFERPPSSKRSRSTLFPDLPPVPTATPRRP
jgi:hypothetical protein